MVPRAPLTPEQQAAVKAGMVVKVNEHTSWAFSQLEKSKSAMRVLQRRLDHEIDKREDAKRALAREVADHARTESEFQRVNGDYLYWRNRAAEERALRQWRQATLRRTRRRWTATQGRLRQALLREAEKIEELALEKKGRAEDADAANAARAALRDEYDARLAVEAQRLSDTRGTLRQTEKELARASGTAADAMLEVAMEGAHHDLLDNDRVQIVGQHLYGEFVKTERVLHKVYGRVFRSMQTQLVKDRTSKALLDKVRTSYLY